MGSELIWHWVVIDPVDKEILSNNISKEQNMFVVERFISNIIKEYGTHPVSIDGGSLYPQTYKFLKLNHHLHSSLMKSLIERTMQYIRDRIENFDDYFPCKRKERCNHFHVKNWLALFVNMHNKEVLYS